MTREEAIEVVKERLDYYEREKRLKAACEVLIPELAESEDERIRKWILEKVQGYASSGIPCSDEIKMADKAIDYLEKQKENPKSSDSIPSDYTSDAKCEDRWHKVGDSLPDNGRLVLAQDCLGNTLLARYDGEGNWEVSVYDKDDYYCRNTITKWCEIPSEKQKEQKPWKVGANAYFTTEQKQEWSEEDRKHLNSVLLSLNRPFYNMNEQEKSDFDWLHELPERFNLQPKQEWSKEDETYLQDALWCVKQAYKLCKMENDTGTCWSAEKWLKSLRPQYHGDVTMAEAYKMGLEAGKASSWKPSEEQMKAMSYFVRKHQATANRATTKWPEFEAFKSLYNELKKLM